MRYLCLLLLFFAIGNKGFSQPRCFVVGPAMNFGNTKVDNYAFTKTYSVDPNGLPTTQFSNFMGSQAKNTSAGLMMDFYTKNVRFASDIMIPFEGSSANYFNANLAFGGYIKEKFGILIGGSYYANKKSIADNRTDVTGSHWALTDDYTIEGDLYNDANIANQLGANLLFNIALAETFVIRFDYGMYFSNIMKRKLEAPEGYDFESAITQSNKFEVGAVWQISEIFGMAIKYNRWKATGDYQSELSFTDNDGIEQMTSINLLPTRTYISNNFTFCIMIPLGNASASSSTITVVD